MLHSKEIAREYRLNKLSKIRGWYRLYKTPIMVSFSFLSKGDGKMTETETDTIFYLKSK